MKYPNKLIESHTHGTRSHSALIKTAKAPKPELPKLSCTGATSTLKLKFIHQNYNSDGMPIAPSSMWYNFVVDDLYYFNHNFAESATFGPIGGITITGHYYESDNSLNISVSSDEGAGRNCRLVMKDHVDYVNSSYLDIEEASNPTCFRSDDADNIYVCLLTTEPQISCAGATDYLSFIIGEPRDGYQLNHTTLVYNISIDGVDYGEYDLTQGYLNLGHMALYVSLGSEGSGTMYASTANGGNPPARFAFTPRSDMVDANFWGINEESNPTAIYNSANRSIQVCMTFSANT